MASLKNFLEKGGNLILLIKLDQLIRGTQQRMQNKKTRKAGVMLRDLFVRRRLIFPLEMQGKPIVKKNISSWDFGVQVKFTPSIKFIKMKLLTF